MIVAYFFGPPLNAFRDLTNRPVHELTSSANWPSDIIQSRSASATYHGLVGAWTSSIARPPALAHPVATWPPACLGLVAPANLYSGQLSAADSKAYSYSRPQTCAVGVVWAHVVCEWFIAFTRRPRVSGRHSHAIETSHGHQIGAVLSDCC